MQEGSTGSENEKKLDLPWLIAAAAIAAAATFLRFYDLTLKPLHHDEGVNGFFLTTLFRDGVYKYDPANYHGPTLYYISLAFSTVGGLTTTSVRSSVAVFGVLTVILAFFLKQYLGRVGSLAGALFLALSPGMVYISRYFIHEMFFVFCSFAVVVATVYFIEKRRAGPFAVAWLVLLLLVFFLPSGLNLAAFFGGDSETSVWAFRAGFFLVEAILVYFVVQMLLDWRDGRPVYLILASASAALLFATKETAFITLGTMLIACGCVWLWRKIWGTEAVKRSRRTVLIAANAVAVLAALVFNRHVVDAAQWVYEYLLGENAVKEPFAFYTLIVVALAAIFAWAVFIYFYRNDAEPSFDEPVDLTWSDLRLGLRSGSDLALVGASVGVTFIYLNVLFFSSFFTYAEGVQKALEAYAIWTRTGTKDHTQNGLLAYVKWGMKVEAPLLLLSPIGAAAAMVYNRHRFAMFTALWGFGLFAAYTIIPYKTPWLALSFYLPLCLIAGYGIGQLVEARKMLVRIAGVILAGTACVMLTYQAYDLNFVRYDDEEMGYVYAHSKRPMLDLVAEIEHYAQKSGLGQEATIEIVSPDYWPLTWYLNDYKHANFHGQFIDANASEMIVAKKTEQDVEAVRRYAAHYKFTGVWALRPGVDLVLLVRKDLADPDAQELYKLYEYEDKK